MDEIRIGEKTYISSKRAAAVTGYAKDYVGQLCREGHVDAKMVGRSWYVSEQSIRAHRFGDDSNAPDEVIGGENEEILSKSADWSTPTYLPETTEPIVLVENTAETPESQQNQRITENASLTDMQLAWKEWFDRKQTPAEAAVSTEIAQEELVEEADDPVEEMPQNIAYEAPVWSVEEDEADTEEDQTPVAIQSLESKSEPNTAVQEFETEVDERVELTEEAVSVPVRKIELREMIRPPISNGKIVFERVVQKPQKAQKRPKKAKSNTVLRATLLSIALLAISIGVFGSGILQPYLQSFDSTSNIVPYLVGDRVITK